MRRFNLLVAVMLLLSTIVFSQHSSSTSVGSSASSSGGNSSASSSFHSSSSGGGSSSASPSSSHSSGVSVSHASSMHTSSAGSGVSHSNLQPSHSNAVHSIHEPAMGRTPLNRIAESGTRAQPEKRSVFAFLRHPFRKPEPKPVAPVADLRHRVCLNGPCQPCPAGQVHGKGGCASAFIVMNNDFCSRGEGWSGGACLVHARFLDDCSGLRIAMEQQAQRMQQAEAGWETSCSATPLAQECSELSSRSQSEAGLYRTWQDRYQQCLQRRLTAYPYGGYSVGRYSTRLLLDPFGISLDYP